MIGNWYIYNDKIEATVMEINDGIFDDGKIIPPDPKDTLDNQVFSGKVIYNPRTMVHIIICNEDMTACNQQSLQLILTAFHLNGLRCDVSSPTLYYGMG